MWWRRKAADEPSLAEGWIGKLEFDIPSPSGGSMGVLVIELREDTVDVRFSTWLLGRFKREELRSWMTSPTKPLAGESCVWSMQRRGLSISLGCASPDLIPQQISKQLQTAVCGA